MGKLKSLLKAELVKHKVKGKPDPGVWIFRLRITPTTITIPAICLNM